MQDINELRIGFIGLGNMGGAVAEGLVRAGLSPAQLYACGGHFEKLVRRCQEITALTAADAGQDAAENGAAYAAGAMHPCHDATEVADHADLLFLAVKPGKVPEVLQPAAAHFAGKLVVSVVWGYDLMRYQKEALLPDSAHLLCTIPNTPVSVCKGIFVAEKRSTLTAEEQHLVQSVLERISMVLYVDTAQMNIGGIIGGCAPAFADVFMEAMADAAVMYGIPRNQAYPLVSRMLEGTAALQLSSGRHPAAMKDDVCSPGGATIRGIASLEEHGFRGAVIDAVKAIQGD